MTKEEFNANIDELYTKTKAGLLPREARFKAVEALVDKYVDTNGKTPEVTQLDRLSTLCLYEEITNPHPDKMTREEYPILSDTQQEERHGDEVSFAAVGDYGTDGKSYRQPKRKTFGIDVDKKSRNDERHRTYKEFTKVQPVKVYFAQNTHNLTR
jgi:hypothetical protein